MTQGWNRTDKLSSAGSSSDLCPPKSRQLWQISTMEVDKKETKLRLSWDACREVPVIEDEQNPRKRSLFLKWLTCSAVGTFVFLLAVFSKTSFLLLVTLRSNTTTSDLLPYRSNAMLGIGCVLIGPHVLLLIKSLWKFFFKSSAKPYRKTILWVLVVESVVGVGEGVLTTLAMPQLDVVTNSMILNSVCILSAVFQVAAECLAKEKKRVIMLPVLSVFFVLLGYTLFLIGYLVIEDTCAQVRTSIGLAIAGTICVSLNWWENYSTLFKISSLEEISKDMARSRNVVCILSGLLKVLITAAVVGASLSPSEWSHLRTVPTDVTTTVFSLVAIQIGSSVMCQWFVVVACKMHTLRRCFLVPVYMASAAVLLLLLTPLAVGPFAGRTNSSSTFCENELPQDKGSITSWPWLDCLMASIKESLCSRQVVSETSVKGLAVLALSSLSWWLGLVFSTVYIWFLKIQRIERTQDLFLKRMYEGAFLEQSVLLNTRFEIRSRKKEKRLKETVKVYLCATMWHETYDEMMNIIISMFRLDKYRPKINKHNDVIFEFHIYLDDAFKDTRHATVRHVNEYAETLVKVIREVYINFSEDDPCIFKMQPLLPQQKIISAPYGGRLEYTLPKDNVMMVHLKDKQLIRHKKRWSQIMYLYYLLGWRLNRKYFKMFEEGGHVDTLKEKLKREKENTYILALDGDTDFQPSAVMLLIDRLKLYPDVGAACGRIHPTGSGPVVWYQKFEYAVGHWLQKTAEHVLGCVLCSPGCFSLFRASALMDDNVMKRYTTKTTEASHHIQYDQGEDRWLCTLLLQQGWRVEYNAASDAYTNAPQDFREFYNQRRRWGPSTMANTVDLLSSGGLTSRRNSSISKPYIFYQIISMGASILGPATICLMIAGSFTFILNMDQNTALILATVPPAVYLALCFKLKADTQIQIAGLMSILYAFLMTGTILSIIGSIVKQQTFMTPSGLFLISMMLLYLTTAALHPQEFSLVIYGLLYFLCIPSGYLLLPIYSIVNMNNVMWGTRETGSKAKSEAVSTLQRQVLQVTCCQHPCWNHGGNRCEDINEIEPLLEPTVAEEKDLKVHMDCEKNESSHECLGLQTPKSWIEALQIKFEDFQLHKATLSEDETEFWKQLQKKYLEPLKENKEQQEKIAKDLKDLRNKVAFVIFISNALWIVTTLFLQTIGSVITLPIPKMYLNGSMAAGEQFFTDPVALVFLLSFTVLLFIQFFAMLYHRIYTLIHFVAYVDTEANTARKHSYEENYTFDQKVPECFETNSEYKTKHETALCKQNPATVSESTTVV